MNSDPTRDGGLPPRADAAPVDGGERADAAPPPRPYTCGAGEWCWEHPRPQGDALHAVALIDERAAWAVGARGVVLRFDGAQWVRVRTATDVDLRGVWAAGPDDAFAWGLRTNMGGNIERAEVLRWDGASWSTARSGAPQGYRALAGSARDNVWVIAEGRERTDLERWDGAAWRTVSPLPDGARASDVCVRSPTDVWVSARPRGWSWARTVYHWDGAQWREHAPPLDRDERLHEAGVACASDGALLVPIWQPAAGAAALWRFDGAGWHAARWPLPASSYGARLVTTRGGVVLFDFARAFRWDGEWRALPAFPTAGDNTRTTLEAVDFGAGLATGWGLNARGDLVPFRAGAWDASVLTPRPNWTTFWHGNSPAAPPLVLGDGFVARPSPAGDVWTVEPAPIANEGMTARVRAVWDPRGASNGWAVGERGATLLVTPAGSTITFPSGTTTDLHGVSGCSPDDAWAIGADATLLHWNGTQWGPSPAPLPRVMPGADPVRLTSLSLESVACAGPRDAWIVGSDPAGGRFVTPLFHWDGARWTIDVAPPARNVSAIWALPSGELWLEGDNALWRRDRAGGAWSRVADEHARVTAIEPGPAGEVYLLAHRTVFRWRGAGSALEPMPINVGEVGFNALWVGANGDLRVAGTGGAIMQRRRE